MLYIKLSASNITLKREIKRDIVGQRDRANDVNKPTNTVIKNLKYPWNCVQLLLLWLLTTIETTEKSDR